MLDTADLLALAKLTASSASQRLCQLNEDKCQDFEFSTELPREMKAQADQVIEKEIIEQLATTGLPILSEETGEIAGDSRSGLKFIVDPLDGTVNFIRGLGSASVSIALYQHDKPVFGVLGVYPTGDLVWGGKAFGAFFNDQPIKVSTLADISKAVLCTGFPSRFDFDDSAYFANYMQGFARFAKVRMLGAASVSLMKVAEGAADVYMENNIMLWDVAAGLAIVEGAGGKVTLSNGQENGALNVEASNGKISFSHE
jgi:myo-inositol-1(or 4)-monophosphatase